MKRPLITIIIPVYNSRKFLRRCVRSVLCQTYSNLEIILVDDGSVDGSDRLCDWFARQDKRIKAIHKQNGGASSARNVGLNAASGDYIGFVDSDDYVNADMYRYLLALLVNCKADIAVCRAVAEKSRQRLVTEGGENVKVLLNEELWSIFYRINGEASNYSVCNRLYAKNVLKGVRFAEGKITEDVLFTYEVYKNCRVLVLSERIGYIVTRNIGSVTNSRLQKKDMDLLEIWDGIVKKECGGKYYEWAVLNRKRATYTLYVKGIRYGVGMGISRLDRKRWKKEIRQNYHELMNSNFFDWRRKFILFGIRYF